VVDVTRLAAAKARVAGLDIWLANNAAEQPPAVLQRGRELRQVGLLDVRDAESSLKSSAATARFLEWRLDNALRGVIKAQSQIPWD
jgi:hypothetical protein